MEGLLGAAGEQRGYLVCWGGAVGPGRGSQGSLGVLKGLLETIGVFRVLWVLQGGQGPIRVFGGAESWSMGSLRFWEFGWGAECW